MKQGKTEEALEVADQSRSLTLAQGLGLFHNQPLSKSAVWHPMAIAQKANATLLFYWLSEKQSYLWAITPQRTSLFQLPSQSEILPVVERYRRELLSSSLDASNQDGAALYRMLVAPASSLIPSGSTVAILSDGPLSLLNFETLIVPGTSPHYWIEDAALISSPSLYMLASATPAQKAFQKSL